MQTSAAAAAYLILIEEGKREAGNGMEIACASMTGQDQARRCSDFDTVVLPGVIGDSSESRAGELTGVIEVALAEPGDSALKNGSYDSYEIIGLAS